MLFTAALYANDPMPNSARARDNRTHFQGHEHVIHLCELREYAIRTYFFFLFTLFHLRRSRLYKYIRQVAFMHDKKEPWILWCTEGNWIGSRKAEEHRPSRTCINRHRARPMAHLCFSVSVFWPYPCRGVLNSKCAPHYYYCSFLYIPILTSLLAYIFSTLSKIRGEKLHQTLSLVSFSIRHLA